MRTCPWVVVGAVGALIGSASGAIDLEFRAVQPVYNVGDTVEIGLYAVSDSGAAQSLSATEVIFGWDTAYLGLLGLDGTGGAGLSVADFMTAGSGGINESNPPSDGDGLFFGFATLGVPVNATPGGTLLTTFQFQALAETSSTPIDVLATGGAPVRSTVVYDGVVPNTVVTGQLFGDTVTIVPAPGAACLGVLAVVGAWRRRRV